MKFLIDYLGKDYLKFNKDDVIYLIGITDFSFNISNTYFKDEVLDEVIYLKNLGYKVFVNLERIYFDSDFIILQEILDKLCNYIDGVTYSDVGLYQFIKDNYKIKTIYHLSQMTTNTSDINVDILENDSLIIGKEISFNELVNINNNINKNNKLIGLDGFGKFPIFTSRRMLLSTYFDYREIKDNPKDLDYSLIEETRCEAYPIKENNYNSIVYETGFYYLDSELDELNNIDYLYLCSNFLTSKLYLSVINIYINKDYSKLSELGINLYKGKLDSETVLLKGGN